ncbi:hypothetical protein V2J09_002663 [Rumex salicifolius]
MESKDPDDNCNTETEEETIAMMKKRARRVSFAETTAVHFFDRDEESDKKAPTSEAGEDDALRRTESDEIRALLQASGVSAEEEGEEGDDEAPFTARNSFFRPIESPSPASSTFGSATSNDEDNFFGPISAGFIKRGLSNSAEDYENHDITMDSATFSMHFRSLAKSDSGEVKTPTGFRLAFGESSQTETAKSTLGNSMVLTRVKSPIVYSSPDVERITGSCNSSDMSLVRESLDGYDYGQLSPGLNALLAEGQKDVVAVSSSTQLEGSILTDYPQKDSKSDGIYQNGTPQHLMDNTPIILTVPESPSHAHEEETNVPYAQTPADQRMQNISSYEECSPMSGKLSIDTNPTQMEDVFAAQESVRNAEKTRKRKAEFDQRGTLSDLNSENQAESFLTGSISSLNAKRRQIFKDLTTSSDHHWNSAFRQKQPGSFHNKGNDRIICSLPPLPGKSISRLKWLKTSPFASLYNDGAKHSKITLSGSVSRSSPKSSILDVPVACLEEQFSSASRDREKKNMNDSDTHMLDQNVGTRLSLSIGNVSEDDRPTIPSPSFTNSEEGMVGGASPFHIRSWGKEDNELLLINVSAEEVNLISSGSDSSLLEITLDDQKYVKPAVSESPKVLTTLSETPAQVYTGNLSKDVYSIATPNSALRSSSVTEEKLVTSESMEYGPSHLETPKQAFSFTLHEGRKLIANNKEADIPTPATEDPGLLIDKGMLISGLGFELNDASEIGIIGQNTVPNNLQLNCQTPVRHGASEQHHFGSSDKSIRTANRKTVVGDELPAISKNYQQEHIHSSLEEQCSSAHDSEVLELRRKDDLTLDSHELRLENACSNVQNAFDIHEENYSSKMKNLSGKLGADMEEAADILHKHQHFLNDYDSAGELHSRCFNGIGKVTHMTDGDKIPQNLTDVLINFNLLMEKWFSSSVVKLDKHVDKLEDIMSNLQKYAASKNRSSGIRSQKMSEEFDRAHLKRVAKTKFLMYEVLYGKVKMQLMHLKKKKLLNQIELLQSAVQESKLLKSKYCCKTQGSSHQDTVVGGCNSKSYTADPDEYKDTGKSIYVLKKDLDDSERKIENLIGSFHTSLKMPGQPSCNKTIAIAIVLDHLKRKAPCWFLHHEFQLWEVDNAETKNGQLDVVLNYDEIISQRFKLKHKPKPSIIISSELINTRISKTWPKMSASVAFEFALRGKTTLKYTGPVVFARETQRISSVLSNLCDVLEEIKLAQIELSNMAKSIFYLPSVGRLVLQLTFINFIDGRRVVLSFDIGVYPSDIIPYEVGDASTEKQKLISQTLLDEIKSSIGGLRSGYMRLLRLCRCVSSVLIQDGS